jgi:hypothetical protein
VSGVPNARAPAALLLSAVLIGGCGGDRDLQPRPGESPASPVLGQRTDAEQPTGGPLGFPQAATKNTTRIGGTEPVITAAAVALAVHPSGVPSSRPAAVTLVDRSNWAAAISAAQLAATGIRAPVLMVDGTGTPTATQDALALLQPAGLDSLDDAQSFRVGTAVRPEGLSSINIEGTSPAALARGIDALRTRAVGEPSRSVVVAGLESPAFAMPAAGWAARSGDPVLWTSRDSLPPDTVAAIRAREDPRIYVLGPKEAVSAQVLRRLERLGDVKRIGARDPVRGAIAFARFRDRDFGWGVVDPGHGLVLASAERPADAAAASPLSGAGTYGPLLLLEGTELPRPLRDYLLDIRPGYESDPVRGVYNHAWLMGDVTTISVATQSHIDSLLEIQPVDPIP